MTQPKLGGDLAAEEARRSADLDALGARVGRLEEQVRVLAEATLALARGMEGGPMEEPGENRAERAARLAHELLLAAEHGTREGETA